VTDATRRTVEAHLLDFDKDLYGLNIALDFFDRLRGEQKFASVQALVAQIKSDVATTRSLLGDNVMRDT
jgi:riboflavin kinase/FMN adenylyltransferase